MNKIIVFGLSVYLLISIIYYQKRKSENIYKELKDELENKKEVENKEEKELKEEIFKIPESRKRKIPKVIFVSPEIAYKAIINSGYMNSLNPINLKARNCKTVNDCKRIYARSLEMNIFSEGEKRELFGLTSIILEKLSRNNSKEFLKLPWKFAKIDENIENGMPHTHEDIIFLSDSFFNILNTKNEKIKTLIHEQVHIYQRKRPKYTQELYEYYDYKKVGRNYVESKNRRINPDLDNYDYNYKGKIYLTELKDNASNLRDSEIIVKTINGNIGNNYDKINEKMIYDNKELKEVDKELTREEDKLEILLNGRNGINTEHPNELFAGLIADIITNDENLDEKMREYLD
jgi:hypothetical protein